MPTNDDWPHGVSDKIAKEIVDRLQRDNWTRSNGGSKAPGESTKKRASLEDAVGWLLEINIAKKNIFSSQIEVSSIPIKDSIRIQLRMSFKEETGLSCGRQSMDDAIEFVSDLNSYDPLNEYFSNLKWDGHQRLEQVLVNSLGADDTAYVREVTKRFLVSAVSRALNPGCFHRIMLILIGEEFKGKSLFCRDLCPNENWFMDYLPRDLNSVRAIEALQGKFIVESAELVSMRKSEVETVKAFLSRPIDYVRLAYRRDPVNLARRCVLIGTTNNFTPLNDESEGTRFWPVLTPKYSRQWLLDNRDQIWAEAKALLDSGFLWWDMDDLVKQEISDSRDGFREGDPWDEVIRNIETATYQEWTHQEDGFEKRCNDMPVCISCTFPYLRPKYKLQTSTSLISEALGIPSDRQNRSIETRIGQVMKKYEWTKIQVRQGKDRRWLYFK